MSETSRSRAVDGLVQVVVEEVLARLRAENPPAAQSSRLLTIKQAADYMGCSTRTVRRFIDTGRLDRVGSDRFIRVERRDLDRLIDDSKEKAI